MHVSSRRSVECLFLGKGASKICADAKRFTVFDRFCTHITNISSNRKSRAKVLSCTFFNGRKRNESNKPSYISFQLLTKENIASE